MRALCERMTCAVIMLPVAWHGVTGDTLALAVGGLPAGARAVPAVGAFGCERGAAVLAGAVGAGLGAQIPNPGEFGVACAGDAVTRGSG